MYSVRKPLLGFGTRAREVTYHKTYKLITNSYTGDTIVAYQSGTDAPNITADLTIAVPVTKTALTSTTLSAYASSS